MDMLQKGAQWLDDQRHKFMALTVQYARGVSTVDLLATVGRTEFEEADEFGLINKIESRDYVLRASDLIFGGPGGIKFLPEKGDQIREVGEGGQTFVYEVMAFGGEPPFRHSDVHRQALRVHTKHIGTEYEI